MNGKPDKTDDAAREQPAPPLEYAPPDPDTKSALNVYVLSLFGAVALAGVVLAARLIYELLDGK